MTDHDAREAQDSAALTAARAIYGNSFDPAVHVVQFDTMRQAARAILASLPAPTPAAGEAVAWMYTKHTGQKFTSLFQRTHYDGFPISDETPLYAAPQPTEQCANIAQKSEQFAESAKCSEQATAPGGDASTFDLLARCEKMLALKLGASPLLRDVRAALANHSPDAGGVGEVIAWLRGTSHRAPLTIARQIADAIERGEHIADPALRPDPRGEG